MVSIFVFVADEGPVAKGASYYQQAGRERDFEGEDPIMDAYRDNVGFNDDGQQKLLDAARDEMVRERSQILRCQTPSLPLSKTLSSFMHSKRTHKLRRENPVSCPLPATWLSCRLFPTSVVYNGYSWHSDRRTTD